MSKLRVGLIGCGWFARAVHLPILRRLPEVEVIALAEPDPARRREASSLVPSARTCEHYRDVFEMAGVDAVVISVPTPLHADVAVAAMERGKHVYLEKPIAMSLSEADWILDVWKRADVVGMVGFNYRFNPLHQAARMQLQAGKLGSLVGVRSVFSTPTRPMPGWKQTRSTGGGVLLEMASHHIDLVRFLLGQDIRTVYAEIQSRCTEHDTATLHLQLADGLQVQSFFSLCALDEDRFEIYGQAGKLTMDRYRSLDVEIVDAGGTSSRLRRITRRLRSLRNVPYLFKKLRSPWHEPSYRESLCRFVSAARGRDRASPDLLDGYRSLEVICAAEQAAQKGQSVSLVPSIMNA